LESQRALRGSDFVGTPDEVIEKILFQHAIFQHQRFLIYLGYSTIEHKKMMNAIELFGSVVAPAVRKEIARRSQIAS
jgi:alkanesulfonate monooxygenase SsuD/methylene tetrahydromethanopterin reductase-like flavin-dependent oxidoreductase (luciferase family)